MSDQQPEAGLFTRMYLAEQKREPSVGQEGTEYRGFLEILYDRSTEAEAKLDELRECCDQHPYDDWRFGRAIRQILGVEGKPTEATKPGEPGQVWLEPNPPLWGTDHA